ncbi:hypothetical protein J3R83DRAFT_7520 [Lanmaoa asiatica]|nr:hypothetical protein J3R83DRAFT_7776 [Lanmaoa asiatica]KAH0826034.1 hypothetical protein J3R83DRAFT_7520 [Lanmaoa asiatica]
MKLWCWIYGDDDNSFFLVEIAKSKIVTALKEAIKKKKPAAFRNVDPDDLVLYKISLPCGKDGEPLKDGLRSERSLLECKSPLNPGSRVSKHFPEPHVGKVWLVVVDRPRSGSSTTEPPVAVPNMTLNCWVRGDMNDTPVEISRTETVAALKKALKDKKSVAFHDIDADDLVLYKVSLQYGDDDSLEHVLGDRSISSVGPPLRNSLKLSAIFISPAADQLHLIVDGLPTSVQCWVRAPEFPGSFQIQISIKAKVDDLKNVIKAACGNDLDNLSPYRLTLYKIPTSVKELPEIGEYLDAENLDDVPLEGNKPVWNVFDDVPFVQTPRVAVKLLDISKQSYAPPQSCRPVKEGATVQTARQKFVTDNEPKKPSATASPSSFRKWQEIATKAIPCGRPRDREDCIPTILLHPVFCQFIQDTKDIRPTPQDNKLVVDLADAMSALYPNESTRVDTIQGVLETHGVHFNVTKTKTTGYETDGDMSAQGYRYVIAEFKNETGSTSAEPYMQCLRYYLESTRSNAPDMWDSPLPCLLLSIFGPYIVFAGAAWNRRPTVQLLSMPIAFHIHTTDAINFNLLTRHMAAFRKAIRTLEQYYRETLRRPPSFLSTPPPYQLFPHREKYTPRTPQTEGKVEEINILYKRQLPNKLVFFGFEAGSGRPICVKFAQQYSVHAHEYCASLHCAPTLRGYETLPGGWYMVIMDDLSEEYITLFDKRHEGFSGIANVKKLIEKKLQQFHGANLVHGDIRDTNVMVSKRKSKEEFMIIDFDWAGTANDAVYPPCVNREGIWRPDGAIDGSPILAAHDMDMLSHIDDK